MRLAWLYLLHFLVLFFPFHTQIVSGFPFLRPGLSLLATAFLHGSLYSPDSGRGLALPLLPFFLPTNS